MKERQIPRVSVVCVGYIYDDYLVEVDCPACGKSSGCSVPMYSMPPFYIKIACGHEVAIQSIVIHNDEELSLDDGD